MGSEKLKHLISWTWKIFQSFIWTTLTATFFTFLNSGTLYKSEKKFLRLWGSWYLKWPAWTQDFNTKIVFEIYTPSPEILAQMYPNLAFHEKCQKFLIIFPVSVDPINCPPPCLIRVQRVLEGGGLFLSSGFQLCCLRGACIPNLDPPLCLEPLKKFWVGGWMGCCGGG